jgi:general stress protein CsbA
MSRRNLARGLYIGLSLILVDYAGVMLLHASNKEEYLEASHVSGEAVPYVYYGTIATCVILQILVAYIGSTLWLSSKLTRLRYTGLLLIGVLIAVTARLKHIDGIWIPAIAYILPQLLIISGGSPRRPTGPGAHP